MSPPLPFPFPSPTRFTLHVAEFQRSGSDGVSSSGGERRRFHSWTKNGKEVHASTTELMDEEVSHTTLDVYYDYKFIA